jgi:dienelactone hydrolase
MAHGSENFGWLPGTQATPFLVAAQGVSTFIFDKRGTGGSSGTFHMNFRDLAVDLVAASSEAKRLAQGRYSRFGLHGGSQGGWTVPLAAKQAGADFVVVSFGGVFSPEEEDSEQVLDELRSAGFGADVLAKAQEVTKATGEVVASQYQRGYEELARIKAQYGGEPWFRRMRGEYTGGVLSASEPDLRRRVNSDRIDWRHDSVAVIRENLTVPTLWILAAEDREAPGRLTEERLEMLIGEGKPITVAVFPDTDHGMVEFTTSGDGTRKVIRVTDGYHRLLADWMRGSSNPPYGRARFLGTPATR